MPSTDLTALTSRRFDGIDYKFRPDSYWGLDDDELKELLRNVKGANRRKMIRDYWESGRIKELHEDLLKPETDGELIQKLGKIHPSFMGGEFLPGYRKFEVEIARIELASTLCDVTIWARPAKGRGIRYCIVDEYDTCFDHSPKSSRRPLTLDQLIRMIDGIDSGEYGGLALCGNVGNADPKWGPAPAELRHFTTITSDFYPGLNEHYEQIYDIWVQDASVAKA